MPKPALVTALALSSALAGAAFHQMMVHASRATSFAMTIALDPGRFAAEATVAGIRLALDLCWRTCSSR
ncbi:hypothetical protein [Sphingobium nicotianae]|uniref:Uncharacterized protein n=1 Tax=Sphingobium nicotianae TaxID=2782607 RepID=A0A9X1IPM9_9SPHN|nr:hypothetical protein [Sphingobium nicotianae]MBT2185955.1 hypothetical protein [Sphingobium nicotianae]